MREVVMPELATKTDLTGSIRELELAFRADLRGVEERLRAEMWKHSVAQIFGIMAVGGFLIRFVK